MHSLPQKRNKSSEWLERMREELGASGTLLMVFVTLILLYQISYLYLQTFL